MEVMRRSLCVMIVLLLSPACSDDVGSEASSTSAASGAGAGAGGSGAGASGSGAGGPGGSTGSGGAPSCADALAGRTSVTTIDVTQAASKAIYAEGPAGGVIAWSAPDGVHVTSLDAADGRVGEDIVIAGTEPFGVAVGPGGESVVLLSRPPDFMSFVRVDSAGAALAEVDLVGGGDHLQQGVEWFGEFARTGRLADRGDGTYAAYFALHRRWPDDIGHQGDTLRLLDANGGALGGWDWGCSHSLDQRIASAAGQLGPICLSDCFPGKGIYFNHDDVEIVSDPAANCAGGASTVLGGVVPASEGGFWLSYGKLEGQSHAMTLARLDQAGVVVSSSAIPAGDPAQHKLARYGGAGLLLGRGEGGSFVLEQRDGAGMPVGEPEIVPGLASPDQDFVEHSAGDVVWAWAEGQTLKVARVRACTP